MKLTISLEKRCVWKDNQIFEYCCCYFTNLIYVNQWNKPSASNMYLCLDDPSTISSPQERLLQFVSLSASGLATELKQTESAAREALARAVFSIAEQDPEFILKVT